MKKILFAVLALLLALPMAAVADDALTLSGAALNQAQLGLFADESATITETDLFDGETFISMLWHGADGAHGDCFTLLDEDGTITRLRSDYGIRLSSGDVNPETLVFMPGVLAETRENLRQQLALFDDEESYLFAAQPDGTLTAVMRCTLDGETITETYVIASDTHELTAYSAQLADSAGSVLEAVDIQVVRGQEDPSGSFFADWPDDETFPLTLVAQSGETSRIDVPTRRTVRFTDGIDDVLMFADAALTLPVDCVTPADMEASNGLTLYEGLSEDE